jgi:hypothetical protein
LEPADAPSSRQIKLKENLIYHLNQAYSEFMTENSDFKGKFSLLAHSLGSVITYDVLKTRNLKFPVENFFAIGSPLGFWLALRGKNTPEILETTDNYKYFFNVNFSDDIVAHKIEPLFKETFQRWDESFECAVPTQIVNQQLSLDSWNIDFELPSTEGLLHKIPYYPEIVGVLNHSLYWESKDLMNFIIQVLHKGSRNATVNDALRNDFNLLIRKKNERLLSEIEDTRKKIKFNSETVKVKSEEVKMAENEAKKLICANFGNDSVIDLVASQDPLNVEYLRLQEALAALKLRNEERRRIEADAAKALNWLQRVTVEVNAFENQVAQDKKLLEKLIQEQDAFKNEVQTFCADWHMPHTLEP